MQRRSLHSRPVRRTSGNAFGAWLASVALLLQIVVPVGQAVPLPAGDDDPLRALVICTAYGPRAMSPDQQESQGRTASPSGAGQACPVCTALGLCGLSAPAVTDPLPAVGALVLRSLPPGDAVRGAAPVVARARGPPPPR